MLSLSTLVPSPWSLSVQEKFKFMDPGLRQRLRQELEKHQPDYGLDDVRRPPSHRPMDGSNGV